MGARGDSSLPAKAASLLGGCGGASRGWAKGRGPGRSRAARAQRHAGSGAGLSPPGGASRGAEPGPGGPGRTALRAPPGRGRRDRQRLCSGGVTTAPRPWPGRGHPAPPEGSCSLRLLCFLPGGGPGQRTSVGRTRMPGPCARARGGDDSPRRAPGQPPGRRLQQQSSAHRWRSLKAYLIRRPRARVTHWTQTTQPGGAPPTSTWLPATHFPSWEKSSSA